MSLSRIFVMAIVGIIPSIPLVMEKIEYAFAFLLPVVMLILLSAYMRKKIGGYTGDCCGATFLLCEVSMLVGVVFLGLRF